MLRTIGQCAQEDTTVIKHFPVDLPLLSRFFQPHELGNFTNRLHTDPLYFDLPQFEIGNQNRSDLVTADSELVMNLCLGLLNVSAIENHFIFR